MGLFKCLENWIMIRLSMCAGSDLSRENALHNSSGFNSPCRLGQVALALFCCVVCFPQFHFVVRPLWILVVCNIWMGLQSFEACHSEKFR